MMGTDSMETIHYFANADILIMDKIIIHLLEIIFRRLNLNDATSFSAETIIFENSSMEMQNKVCQLMSIFRSDNNFFFCS